MLRYGRYDLGMCEPLGEADQLDRLCTPRHQPKRVAQVTMGAETAAATVAATLQRAEHIKSPGGYPRTLVERKRAGRYSLGPVLMALNRARLTQCRAT